MGEQKKGALWMVEQNPVSDHQIKLCYPTRVKQKIPHPVKHGHFKV